MQPPFGSPPTDALPSGPPPPGIVQEVQEVVAQPARLVWGVDPLIAGVTALVVLSALASGRRWLALRERPPATEFESLLAKVDEVAVLTHPKPDPDAMASAVAVQRIAEQAGTPATVQYPGEIRHPENRAFPTVLDLDLEPVASADDLAADVVVLVDHHEPRGFEGADDVRPYAVVDHHPGAGDQATFVDVRTEYGACSSILTEYLEVLDAEVEHAPTRVGDADQDSPAGSGDLVLAPPLATGLALGILSDTRDLTRGCSRAEFAAMEYLHPAVDETLLDRVANPQVDVSVLETRARAVLERHDRPPHVVSDVGGVENLDAIPQAAEELLSLEGITTAVVLGDDDGTLYVSGRSRDDRVHVGRALQSAFDDLPGASAGGHARMGGAQLPLADVDGLRAATGPFQSPDTLTRAGLHERLFDAIAGET